MSSEPAGTSLDLLNGVAAGDEQAADAIFERYASRLVGLARTRLAPRLASRIDPEDVTLSAWRSFFVSAREQKFALQRSGDLWRLLVAITLHKLRRQVRRHQAEKRDVRSEAQPETASDRSRRLITERLAVDEHPTPEEAVGLADELEAVMNTLDAEQRRALELRLQGHTWSEIAEELRRSERTVRRWTIELRFRLAERFGLVSESGDDD